MVPSPEEEELAATTRRRQGCLPASATFHLVDAHECLRHSLANEDPIRPAAPRSASLALSPPAASESSPSGGLTTSHVGTTPVRLCEARQVALEPLSASECRRDS